MGEIRFVGPGKTCRHSYPVCKIVSFSHECMVWINKSVTRVTNRHHEACQVMLNSDPQ